MATRKASSAPGVAPPKRTTLEELKSQTQPFACLARESSEIKRDRDGRGSTGRTVYSTSFTDLSSHFEAVKAPRTIYDKRREMDEKFAASLKTGGDPRRSVSGLASGTEHRQNFRSWTPEEMADARGSSQVLDDKRKALTEALKRSAEAMRRIADEAKAKAKAMTLEAAELANAAAAAAVASPAVIPVAVAKVEASKAQDAAYTDPGNCSRPSSVTSAKGLNAPAENYSRPSSGSSAKPFKVRPPWRLDTDPVRKPVTPENVDVRPPWGTDVDERSCPSSDVTQVQLPWGSDVDVKQSEPASSAEVRRREKALRPPWGLEAASLPADASEVWRLCTPATSVAPSCPRSRPASQAGSSHHFDLAAGPLRAEVQSEPVKPPRPQSASSSLARSQKERPMSSSSAARPTSAGSLARSAPSRSSTALSRSSSMEPSTASRPSTSASAKVRSAAYMPRYASASQLCPRQASHDSVRS